MLLIPINSIYLLLKELGLLNINKSIMYIYPIRIYNSYHISVPPDETPISLIIIKEVHEYVLTYLVYLIDISRLCVITQLNNLPSNTYDSLYLCNSVVLHLNNNSFEINFISSSVFTGIYCLYTHPIDNIKILKTVLDRHFEF